MIFILKALVLAGLTIMWPPAFFIFMVIGIVSYAIMYEGFRNFLLTSALIVGTVIGLFAMTNT